MSDAESTRDMLRRLNEASPSAFGQLDKRYRGQLCRLVEREMGRRFGRREDPEDVVQSALKSFFGALADGKMHVANARALWGVLAKFTRTKIKQHVEYHLMKKRNPDQEEYQEPDQLAAKGATEQEAMQIVDEIETSLRRLLQDFKPRDVEILDRRLRGQGTAAIARGVDCSVAQVNRVLKWITPRFKALLDQDSNDAEEG